MSKENAIFQVREEWLKLALFELNKLVFADNLPLKDVNVSCGFPPGARGGKQPFAVCPPNMSAANEWELFINPVLDQPSEVLAALVAAGAALLKADPEEMVAAAASLAAVRDALIAELGEYPHARILMDNRVKQPTRTFKCQCDTCKYTVRITNRWLKKGTPKCANVACSQEGHPLTVVKDGE